jgi:hypothetical protein
MYLNVYFFPAVRVIQKLSLIPLDPEEVQSYVTNFDMVPEEVNPPTE